MKKNIALIIAGAFSLALAIVFFLSPNHIVSGGPPGIAIILYHALDFNQGLSVFVINAVLMVFALKRLGPGYLIRTALAFGLIALFIELLFWLLPGVVPTTNPMLNALYGGLLVGLGLGLIFKGEAASGGWSILARLLAQWSGLTVGNWVLILDGSICLISALVFGNIESALWAAVGVYVSGLVVDWVLTGKAQSKVVHISTAHAAPILAALDQRFTESSALTHVNTVRDQNNEELVFLVVDASMIATVRSVVHDIDPKAHVVVIGATEFFSGQTAA